MTMGRWAKVGASFPNSYGKEFVVYPEDVSCEKVDHGQIDVLKNVLVRISYVKHQ